MSDGIQSNLGGALTAAEIAEQRRLVQFFNYPWPIGPVILERGESEMAETKIEWADYSANSWRGCSRIAPGCTHCYAATLAKRFPATFGQWGTEKQGGVRVVADLDKLFKDVKRWDRKAACNCEADFGDEHWYTCPQRKPPVVFWNDVSDTFEDWRVALVDREGNKFGWTGEAMKALIGKSPNLVGIHRMATLSDVRRRMFTEGIDANQNLTHVLLTKRPENVPAMWSRIDRPIVGVFDEPPPLYRENVWLLYSASDQATLESGLPHLLACRDLVPVIGPSLEPLLGPVDLTEVSYWHCPRCKVSGTHAWSECSSCETQMVFGPGVDWTIIGCEQLPGHKPGRFADGYAEAALSLIRQCREAGVRVFHKQMPISGRVSGDPSEWPEDFRVREFPKETAQ